MKEHEALEKIENHFINGHVIKRKELYEAIETLKSVLTPPTSDEVCEKLSEHYGCKVEYESSNKTFYISRFNHIEKALYDYIRLEDLIRNPHLITIIGSFYENEAE